jgi:hypothetical protein
MHQDRDDHKMGCGQWLRTVALPGLLLMFAGCGAKQDARVDAAPRGAEATEKRAASNQGSEARDHALAMAKQYGRLTIDDIPRVPKRILVSLLNRRAVDEVLPLLKDVPDLTILGIDRVELREEDFHAIGQLTQIQTLGLQKCTFDEDDLRLLSNLSKLYDLSLTFCPITDDALKYLSAMTGLRRLNLMLTKVRGTGLEHITPKMADLTLSGTLLDDDTIAYCTRFRRLHTLYFTDTRVTLTGLMKLVNMHWLLTMNPPRELRKEFIGRFRPAQKASTQAARKAGEDVPGSPASAAPKEAI